METAQRFTLINEKEMFWSPYPISTLYLALEGKDEDWAVQIPTSIALVLPTCPNGTTLIVPAIPSPVKIVVTKHGYAFDQDGQQDLVLIPKEDYEKGIQ